MNTPLAFLETLLANAKLVEKNDNFYAYTIIGQDDTPYMSRLLTPRLEGQRLMLHRLHRADNDRHLHNHPWQNSHSIILHGGYYEERLMRAEGRNRFPFYGPGATNTLTAEDFHRITYVEPDTWTLFMAGDRVQSWGFWVDGKLVTHDKYWNIPVGEFPEKSTQ